MTTTASPHVSTLAGLLRNSQAPNWQRAACRDAENPEDWFPFPSEDYPHARAVCARCPIRARCLAYAEASGQSGVWGGVELDRGRHIRAQTC
jgi:WhiB family redox-sensing transcriptional regulator